MHISILYQRRDDTLELVNTGSSVTLNGEVFDFSVLNDGDTINGDDIPNEFIVGNVFKTGGVVHISILAPYNGIGPFPDDITIDEDGSYNFPDVEELPDVDA